MRSGAVVSLSLLLLLAAGCERRSPDIQPVRVGAGANRDAAILSELIAQRLEAAECRVERKFGNFTAAELDARIGRGEIDVYVASHREAVRQVMKTEPGEAPENETKLRTAWIRRELLWAPVMGSGELAPVLRKDIDTRCRAASRTLMRSAHMLDDASMEKLRSESVRVGTAAAVERFRAENPR